MEKYFREAKQLADAVAEGDVASLINRGVAALEENGLDGRRHHLAVQRAGYGDAQFSPEDWSLVRECARCFLDADPAVVRAIVREADRHRTPDMNTDLHQWAESLSSDDLALPQHGVRPERLRAWAKRMLFYILNLCEQPLKNYLGIIAAVSDNSESAYAKTQRAMLNSLLTCLSAPSAVVQRLKRLEDKGLRTLRNAGAHIANVTISEGLIHIQSKSNKGPETWQPERMRDVFESLLVTLEAISLGVSIGAGPHYQSPEAEHPNEAVASGSDLSVIEQLFTVWMEWLDAKVSLKDQTITVEARSNGPIRFWTLVRASTRCNMCKPAKTLICHVTPAYDGAVSRTMVIEIPILSHTETRPQDDPAVEEKVMLEMAGRIKIDGTKLFGYDGYGGLDRLQADQRFWEGARQHGFIQSETSDLFIPVSAEA